MKKNGFVFIETIIAIVILTSSLLLLYSTFTKLLQSEKTHVYYDDIAYIYRTWYIKNELKNINLSVITRELNEEKDTDFITIGIEYEDLFKGYEEKKNYISDLLEQFDVSQIIVLKENRIDNIRNCINDKTCPQYAIQISDGLINYLKNISVDVTSYYILVIEYKTCDSDSTNCRNYYSWVSV